MENRRAKQPNVKASWIREGMWEDFFQGKKNSQKQKKKGAIKIEQKMKTRMWSHKRLMKANKPKHGILKGNTEGKQKKQKHQTRETEKGCEKGFGGKKEAKHLSYIGGHSCCVSQIARPVLIKTPALQGKQGCLS